VARWKEPVVCGCSRCQGRLDLVKAICDWADGNKNDAAQSPAAHNAARFVLHVLQLGGWDEATPARRKQKPESIPEPKTPVERRPRGFGLIRRACWSSGGWLRLPAP